MLGKLAALFGGFGNASGGEIRTIGKKGVAVIFLQINRGLDYPE